MGTEVRISFSESENTNVKLKEEKCIEEKIIETREIVKKVDIEFSDIYFKI